MTEPNYFETLDEAECRRLLANAQVGRVIWVAADGINAFPVNYQYLSDQIIFHTSELSQLARLSDPTSVAFQVDDIDMMTAVGWSVLVRGISGLTRLGEPHSIVPGNRSLGISITPQWLAGRVVSGTTTERG